MWTLCGSDITRRHHGDFHCRKQLRSLTRIDLRMEAEKPPMRKDLGWRNLGKMPVPRRLCLILSEHSTRHCANEYSTCTRMANGGVLTREWMSHPLILIGFRANYGNWPSHRVRSDTAERRKRQENGNRRRPWINSRLSNRPTTSLWESAAIATISEL